MLFTVFIACLNMEFDEDEIEIDFVLEAVKSKLRFTQRNLYEIPPIKGSIEIIYIRKNYSVRYTNAVIDSMRLWVEEKIGYFGAQRYWDRSDMEIGTQAYKLGDETEDLETLMRHRKEFSENERHGFGGFNKFKYIFHDGPVVISDFDRLDRTVNDDVDLIEIVDA